MASFSVNVYGSINDAKVYLLSANREGELTKERVYEGGPFCAITVNRDLLA